MQMEFIQLALSKVASGIGPFFLLLGLLIFVHELGHYLVAVWCGVRVETFSLGFGKKIFSFKRGPTTYALSLIPLGGYVKMFGDDPSAEVPSEDRKYSFLHKPVRQRIAIVLAGPLMNLFFAILVFGTIGMIGEEVPGTKIGDIGSQSAAYQAGFRSGDQITSVNGAPVSRWLEIKEIIEGSANTQVTFEVQREEGASPQTITATATLEKNSFLFSTQREIGAISGLDIESAAPMVGIADPKSPAATAGMKTFDVIEAVNGKEIRYWRELEPLLAAAVTSQNNEIILSVRHYNEPETVSPREIRINTSILKANLSEPTRIGQLGLRRSDLFLLNIKPKSPAAAAGLKSGDLVISLDNQEVTSWQAVLDKVKSFQPNMKNLTFSILRDGAQQTIQVTPEQIDLPTDQGAMETRFAIGVVPALVSVPNPAVLAKISNPIEAAWHGVEQSWVWSKLIAISLVRLVQNEVSARNIGGVITIGRVASQSFEVGLIAFLKMMAIISINLFLLNLLPVPVLDGGHLVFFTVEAIKGAPISLKKLEIAQQVGLVLLLSLMLFALFNDISHLISSW
jgi:regulator of sigma E protease